MRHCSTFTGSKSWRLDLLDQLVVERIDLAGHAESAVAQMAAGATGDLAELGGGEIAILIAVELPVLREGDMVEVEIEAHADRVGGDEIVDVARLVERDLGVARARRERAEHDGRAAALAAHELGDGVDLVGREGDDRRAAGQARELLLAGIGEVGEARPRHHRNALQQPLQNAAHGGGAKQQRLLPSAQMQQAIGEDVAALEIAGELHLVDGDEGGVGLARHRLHGADRIARARRNDLLLAGDQRDLVGADLLADAAVDLAREQPERQADQAALMRHHALDGEMRLAGVGRPEHGGHVAARENQRLVGLLMDCHRIGTWPFWLCVSQSTLGAALRPHVRGEHVREDLATHRDLGAEAKGKSALRAETASN